MTTTTKIEYVCTHCGAHTTAVGTAHSLGDDQVCITCWRAYSDKDSEGRVVPSDAADAPFRYHADMGDVPCCCGCHDGDLPVPAPTCTDGWLSIWEGGTAESGPRLNITGLCKGCVDDDHGRFY